MATIVRSNRREGLRPRMLRAAGLLATPLAPADYLDLFDPLRAGPDLRGRIIDVVPEVRGTATVVIEPGRGWRPHRPGQYVRLGVDVDGVRHWRAYSLTSRIDRPDRCITFTVKAIPGGTVSQHLVHGTAAGDIVQLEPAAGDFVLPARPPDKALFVTAGSGLTPVMGLLRNDGLPPDSVVVHAAPTRADVLFGDELRAMAARGRIRLVERHTRTAGRLGPGALSALVPDLADRPVWACGPAGLLDEFEAYFRRHLPQHRLQTERFRPVLGAVGEGGTVTFTRTQTTAETTGATPILVAGERAGVLMPSGCRMGICYGCVATLTEGALRDLRTGQLTVAGPGDRVLVQTCIHAAAGPCRIEL